MKHEFTDPDLLELDRIWPIGQMLEVPDGGIIVVAGSYQGRYLHYLAEMFPGTKLYGYEPQREATLKAVVGRLAPHMNRINIKHGGLATNSQNALLSDYGTDGANAQSTTGLKQNTKMLDAADELRNINGGATIGPFVMNIEGYEWALIPYLLDEMMHHRIRSMAVQFHPHYVSEERAERVKNYMREYYALTCEDTNNWTLWERK